MIKKVQETGATVGAKAIGIAKMNHGMIIEFQKEQVLNRKKGGWVKGRFRLIRAGTGYHSVFLRSREGQTFDAREATGYVRECGDRKCSFIFNCSEMELMADNDPVEETTDKNAAISSEHVDWDPDTARCDHERKMNLVRSRQGQRAFREMLLRIYNGRCAITNTQVTETLQAAHIVEYDGVETNEPQNGILLRADIHNLFDSGLLNINEEHIVCVASELVGTEYEQYDGKRMHVPVIRSEWPSPKALAIKLDR